jgi:antitoxin (DNA-binding transcriptional repressor) of toxin-antitoxin stability system
MTVDVAGRGPNRSTFLKGNLGEQGERMRQRIGLGQLRNSAAYYFDRVAAGESFDVVRRGRMIAQIVPLADPVLDGDGDGGVDREGECRRDSL